MNPVDHGRHFMMTPYLFYAPFGIPLIQPLAYVPEESLRRLAGQQGWSGLSCNCPPGQLGRRAEYRRRLEVLCGGSLGGQAEAAEGAVGACPAAY